MKEDRILYGRELTLREARAQADFGDQILKGMNHRPALQRMNGRYRCERCGTISVIKQSYSCICGGKCVYCRSCLIMGKVRECDTLVSLAEPNLFSVVQGGSLCWHGQLTDQQKKVSKAIAQSIQSNKERVVWAVTGAGKTEMLFEGIGKALDAKRRVCIATPRVDVCLELAPRLKDAFPQIPLAVLYGSAKEQYDYTPLVVATTHQLLRFKEAFDVLIIDEIDAFPYFLNDMLYFAAAKSVKHSASTIYLTATPDRRLRKRIKMNKVEASILPVRYHKHPLPVPAVRHMNSQSLFKGTFSICFDHVRRLIDQEKKFLLFIPTIKMMKEVMQELKKQFSQSSFESVHSNDPNRKEIVKKMREGEFDFLVTTTILERGVTFAGIDVLVFEANHRVYTESALIQIAGRAGRSKECPKGEVIFYCTYATREIKRAIKEIKAMNRLAKKRGLIK